MMDHALLLPEVKEKAHPEEEMLSVTITCGVIRQKALLTDKLKDDTELYKQFVQNESFRRFVTDMVFTLTSGL